MKAIPTGDCQYVGPLYTNPVGVFHVKGNIYPLSGITCTITIEVIYFDFKLPKSSFGDMLQNQRMPDAVIQN